LTIFLPAADTPFAAQTGPIYGLANIYFQAGKFYYFAAPVSVGWVVGLVAIRQRPKVIWPAVGLVLIAWMGATVQIHASRTAVPRGLGHISMDLALGPYSLIHALVILSLAALPYLIWRLQRAYSLST
jgi:hypothetical protein